MADSVFIEINSQYLQSIVDERDEALARNRHLEQAQEAAETMVSALQSLLRDYVTHIMKYHKFWQDEIAERDALMERARILLGEVKG